MFAAIKLYEYYYSFPVLLLSFQLFSQIMHVVFDIECSLQTGCMQATQLFLVFCYSRLLALQK